MPNEPPTLDSGTQGRLIEAHFGPLRSFVIAGSDHPNHVVLARDPELPALAQRQCPPSRRPARSHILTPHVVQQPPNAANAPRSEANGNAHHYLGDHRQAISYYQQAIDLNRDLGHRASGAKALTRLGDTYQAAGDRDDARDAWRKR